MAIVSQHLPGMAVVHRRDGLDGSGDELDGSGDELDGSKDR